MNDKNTNKALYEQIVEMLKDEIVQGKYHKGDLLPSEKELQEITGVSRITIRRALNILSDAGVIETHKGKGSFVVIDPTEFKHSDAELMHRHEYQKYFMESSKARLLIEPSIAQEAARKADKKDIELIESFIQGRKGHDIALSHDNFHIAIAKATGNPVILELMRDLVTAENQREFANESRLQLIPPERQKIISNELKHQHEKILNMIRTHNEEFAYFYMKEHLIYLMKSYEEYFEWFL